MALTPDKIKKAPRTYRYVVKAVPVNRSDLFPLYWNGVYWSSLRTEACEFSELDKALHFAELAANHKPVQILDCEWNYHVGIPHAAMSNFRT